ncbi:2-succinyl-6-hydroxy-2,4-cyclohexadiene-1-carboxylate synthase [Shewanella sp. NKUCC06_TVS]|uniref:2-succinyl-6-hydroxy-2, 4-cyclohexadiene-1-carboxylate synthase n=1 Tax=Shewanella sp. NKUCC06_TVS TaxID=2842128 RepID=UPI001C5BBECA|nr:2-succinyl-6-hydroxy-2,4-cyclohexadiene-1-carboxylate synthase [Shewanella sp. NKUCC06_TVS]MBW3532741.1 2-succinyl-6-hydroxy-2,4-cyclohexadiene-1-carboxylate synthase [Shewanella sp. NKUCC06_TVS]
MPTMARYGNSSLPTLVLLHGFLGTKTDWLPLMPALSHHFHCICLDLPGHGDNQRELKPTELDGFNQCVEDVLAHLNGLHIGQFHLYGYSLGGRIALHLAKAYPERLLSLNLESCHPGLTDPQEKLARIKNDTQWAERLLHLNSKDFLSLWYQQPVFADMTATKRKTLIEHRSAALDLHPKQRLKEVFIATSLAHQASMWDVPLQLTCECHFFAGNQDAKFHALAQEWQLHAPILVHSIHGAGHNIHQAAPEALTSKIVKLLG